LVSGLEINDAEALHAETDTGPAVEAAAIGTTMAQDRGHALEHDAVDRLPGVSRRDPADPTHLPDALLIGAAPRSEGGRARSYTSGS
jgi:hypothetical protein